MKILIWLIISLVFINQCVIAAHYEYTRDGIDKRIAKTKMLLGKRLSKQELNRLDFINAVIHTKDSLEYYVKVPYKDTTKNGFFIVKNASGKVACAAITIEGYRYKDTALKRYFPLVTISYPIDKRNTKTITHGGKGAGIIDVTEKKNKAYKIDSIYKVVTFFLLAFNNDNKSFVVYLNVGLLFDNIDTLNHKAYNDGVIIQDIIPLAFRSETCTDFEYDNSRVLPSIDIKKMFSAFDAKADSVKKQ